jgi:ureidoglycolate lyase
MNKPEIKELTNDNFKKYGAFYNMLDTSKAVKFGESPIEFCPDLIRSVLGNSCIASYSIVHILKRPFIVDNSESHNYCEEVAMALDGDMLIHVGHVTGDGKPPVEDIEFFRVPKGTLISLRPGVWHHAPFAFGCESINVLIVLPERAYANDCIVYGMSKEEYINAPIS